MNLYIHFYFISFILIYSRLGVGLENNLKLIENSVLGYVSPKAVGLKFLVDVNNTSGEDFEVELSPDQCCLELNGVTDCESLGIHGRSSAIVPGGRSQRFAMVAPTIDPLQRKGYCILFLDSKSVELERNVRDTIKIEFDTRVKKNNDNLELPENVTNCNKIDEDPLRYCQPVDCVTYYNDRKPYYDTRVKRCVEAPSCMFDEYAKGPKLIYDPISNKCALNKRVSRSDIDTLKSMVQNNRRPKDIIIFNTRNISKNEPKDSKPIKDSHGLKSFKSKECESRIKAADKVSNKSIFKTFAGKIKKCNPFLLMFFLLIQCCLLWCLINFCMTLCGCGKPKEDSKTMQSLYNYKQDASVTTPLIYTSNIDTETSEYQYISESSLEIDKKIKCYKATQKVKHMKTSLSDDILSKCINRRDWNRKPSKYEAIQEIQSHGFEEILALKEENNKTKKQESKKAEDTFKFENEKSTKSSKSDRKSGRKPKLKQYNVSDNTTSTKSSDDYYEKEIKTHEYDDIVQDSKTECFDEDKKAAFALSTEKGAQIYFPNDSVEDFLSERGVVFTDENTSKDSFSIESNANSGSNISSRTSKNDFVKDVLSMFSKKSKQGPCSEPGGAKKEDLDVKLLHMSNASIHSSSNNGSDCFKEFKKTSGSTVSL